MAAVVLRSLLAGSLNYSACRLLETRRAIRVAHFPTLCLPLHYLLDAYTTQGGLSTGTDSHLRPTEALHCLVELPFSLCWIIKPSVTDP